MGKFDGILICSDWDGTLCVGHNIPEINISSIRYFQENGGKFTVCTGRYYPYIEKFADKVSPNVPLISLNGACIIDLNSRNKLYEGFISPIAFELLDDLISVKNAFKTINFFEYNAEESFELDIEEYKKCREELIRKKYYKLVLIAADEKSAVSGRDYVNSKGIKEITAVRSWNTGLELVGSENTKGIAVKRLKLITGANMLITVGDFENDISMLEAADRSYAVKDTIPAVKASADRITVSVQSGAIAAIISEIEKEIG